MEDGYMTMRAPNPAHLLLVKVHSIASHERNALRAMKYIRGGTYKKSQVEMVHAANYANCPNHAGDYGVVQL